MIPSYKLEKLFLKKDGFYFDRVKYGNQSIEEEDYALVVCSNYKNYVNYVNDNSIKKLIVETKTSELTNLDFLKYMPSIEHLWTFGNIDINYVYKMKKLKQFSVSTRFNGIVEINRISGLESFSTGKPENVIGWDDCKSLKSLAINGYASNKSKIRKVFYDLSVLKNLSSLDVLMISNMSIKSLEGIEGLRNLKVLRLEQNSTFYDLSAITQVKDTLTQLRLVWCPKVVDLEPIHTLKELRFLMIDKNKHIKRIDLSKFPFLSYLGLIDCVFEDGNLTGIDKVDYAPILPLKRNLYVIENNQKIQLKESMVPLGEYIDTGEASIERWRKSPMGTRPYEYEKVHI